MARAAPQQADDGTIPERGDIPMRFARTLQALALGAAAISLPTAALAQAYPNKPVRLVVTYPPGGSSDLLSRAFATELGKLWGQQVLIESKPGAAGSIGIDYAAKQPADGYTFVVGNMGPVAVNPVMSKVPYDTLRDFVPLSLLAVGPNILVVNASQPWKTLREFIADAKAKPGTINYGTSGPGALNHLAGELLKREVGIQMTAIPYKGGVLAVQDLLGNQVQVVLSDALPAMQHIRSGKLRALAITSEKRSPLAPDVPTFAESGVNGLVADNWWGILFPAGTPKPILDKVHADLVKVVQTQEVKERFAALGVDPVSSSPEQFRQFIQAEQARWGKLVKEANIRAE
jgi:tripartite-type tricarboxylate transporter receptor subunit TctC